MSFSDFSFWSLAPFSALAASFVAYAFSVTAELDGDGRRSRAWTSLTAAAMLMAAAGFWHLSWQVWAGACILLSAHRTRCAILMEE